MSTVLHALAERIDGWLAQGRPASVDDARAAALERLAAWIRARQQAGEPADLVFVCTHNSRRSHMAQLWAQAAAAHLGLDRVRAWSGGTETTAFQPRAIAALRAHGFAIAPSGEVVGPENIVYDTLIGPDLSAVRGFSKRTDDPHNPDRGFAAVMVCSDADEACPVVFGADLRVALPWDDPKRADGTPGEAAVYLATSEAIGRQLTWMMALAAD